MYVCVYVGIAINRVFLSLCINAVHATKSKQITRGAATPVLESLAWASLLGFEEPSLRYVRTYYIR